jgi:hypothetical protein
MFFSYRFISLERASVALLLHFIFITKNISIEITAGSFFVNDLTMPRA